MPNTSVTRKLAAILSADVQGYSRLMGDDEVATIRTLTTYREVMTSLIEQHHGRVVDSPGDNLLAEFASAVDGVEGAVAIQQELKTRNAGLPPDRQMHYRIGINVGDVVVEGERIYGDGVNIAARLESLADGGGICISEAVHTQVRNKVDLDYAYQGEQQVKNIAEPVRVYAIQPATENASLRVSVPPVSRGRWSPLSVTGIVLIVLGVGYVAWQQIKHPVGAPVPLAKTASLPLPDKPSIAVLPFTNMSGDPEQEYFSDGMTEDIITDLSKISGLFVIARNSTFTYKGKLVDVAEVGRVLGVRHVLEGSVRKAGNRVRINVQLIDASTGGHVWAERYDRELEDIFTLQDEITEKIVFALKVTLSAEEQARFQQAPTTSLDAYDAYLRGVALAWRTTPETNSQARQLLEQALVLDPQYAAAYSYLAMTYFYEWIFQWRSDPQLLPRAVELAQQAVRLDDTLALAHAQVGFMYVWQKQHARAIETLEHALTVDPNHADTYAWLANTLNFVGRSTDALGLLDQARRLNPHYPFLYEFVLGHTHRVLGQYEVAIEWFKKALTRNPDNLAAHVQLTATYSEAGMIAQARAQATTMLQHSPDFTLAMHEQAIPYQDPAEIERYIAALRRAGLK